MKYRIIVEETVTGEFEVEAESESEALSKAAELYKAADLVLCPGERQEAKVGLVSAAAGETIWEQV